MSKSMSREDMLAYLGEGLHTGLRKATDHRNAGIAWQAINDLPDEDWHAVLECAFQDVQRVIWKKL